VCVCVCVCDPAGRRCMLLAGVRELAQQHGQDARAAAR